jgi:ABC-type transport system involved in Fe-S cluster assembly fused permease/ATPase subunit
LTIRDQFIKPVRFEKQYRNRTAGCFSDSIKSNIKFGKEDATDEEVESAAKSAVVHDNIIGFKKQYETVLEKEELHFPEDKTKSVYRQSDN